MFVQSLTLVFATFAVAVLFLALCWVLGRAIPKSWLIAGPAPFVQHVILGFSILVFVLRLPYRQEYPLALAYGAIAALAIYSLGRDVWRARTRPSQANALSSPSAGLWTRVWPYAVALVPGLLIVYAPLLLNHAITYQYHGPDFDGDLISSDYLLKGHTFTDMMNVLADASGSRQWWLFKNTPYSHPDFQALVSTEFFIRSLRFGHAALATTISKITQQPVWFSFLSLCVYAFIAIPAIVVEAALRRGLTKTVAVILAFIAIGSENYVLLMYEGINIQLIVMPVLIYFIVNWRDILLTKTGLGAKVATAIVLSATISVFGEGIQMLAIFAVCGLLIYPFVNRDADYSIRDAVLAATTIGGLTVLVAPTFFIDFVLWTYGRAQEGFIGGALHANWSQLALMSSFPNLIVGKNTPFILLISINTLGRLLEVGALAAIAVFAMRKDKKAGFDVAVIALTLGVFTLIGHKYAIWKVALVLQPLFLVLIAILLPDRIGRFSKQTVLAGYAVLACGYGLWLVHLYEAHGLPMHIEQFAIDRSQTQNERVAIVTPSLQRIYLRLSASGETYWANGGWRRDNLEPHFSVGGNENLRIALYYDCDAEGKARCAKIGSKVGANLPQRTLTPIDVPIRSLLNESGYVERPKLNALIVERFGVEARGGENPPD